MGSSTRGHIYNCSIYVYILIILLQPNILALYVSDYFLGVVVEGMVVVSSKTIKVILL